MFIHFILLYNINNFKHIRFYIEHIQNACLEWTTILRWTAQNMTIICFGIYSGKHCACVWQCEYKGVLQAGPWGEGEENQGGGADAEWGQPR